MAQIPLSLENNGTNRNTGSGPEKKPVMGWFAIGFGLLGIFTIGFVFVPLGLICSLIALFTGQALWGFIGMMLAAAGFITSPKLWLIVGMSAFYTMVDWQEMMQPILDILKMIGLGETQEVRHNGRSPLL